MDLNPDDFYKELRLRGYQYKDDFLGFVEANGEGRFKNELLIIIIICIYSVLLLRF